MVGTLNFSLANLRKVGRKGNLELVWSFYEHSDKKLCSGLYWWILKMICPLAYPCRYTQGQNQLLTPCSKPLETL